MGQNTRTDLRRKATLFSYDAQDYGFMAAQDSHSVKMQPSNYLGQGDIFIAGLGPFRSAVRWTFNADVGSVSDPLETDDFYAVFTLDSISQEGIAPFEDVRTQVFTGIERDRNIEASSNYANELKAKVETGSSFKELTENNKTLEYVPSDKKKLSSSFISLGKFLEALNDSQLLVEVKSMKLTRIDNDLKRCKAQIEVLGYYKRGEG